MPNPPFDVSPKRPREEVYLGDAVYVSFDGFQLVLRCASPHCVIYLEPSVYVNLLAYVDRLKATKEPNEPVRGNKEES